MCVYGLGLGLVNVYMYMGVCGSFLCLLSLFSLFLSLSLSASFPFLFFPPALTLRFQIKVSKRSIKLSYLLLGMHCQNNELLYYSVFLFCIVTAYLPAVHSYLCPSEEVRGFIRG